MNRRVGWTRNALQLVTPSYFSRWSVAAIASFVVLVVAQSSIIRDSAINPQIELSAPGVVHNGEIKDGQVWVGPDKGPHAEVGWKARIRPQRFYTVRVGLDNEATYSSALVHIDLFGPGYDNAAQEIVVSVPAGARNFVSTRSIPSEASPESVSLRIYHFEPVRLRVAAIEVRELTRLYRCLVAAAVAALVLSTLGWCASGAAIVLSRNLGNSVWQRAVGRRLWLAVALATFLATLMTNALLGAPQILADEYGYWATTHALGTGEWAGLRATGNAEFPSRLFFAAFWPTNWAADAFAVARVLNAVWLTIAVGGLYFASRRMNVVIVGALVALAFGLGPRASYTAYFMPETMFTGMVMAAAVLCAASLTRPGFLVAITSGLLLAALPLVKPTAWAILASVFVYFLVYVPAHWRQSERRTRLAWCVIPISFGFGWLLFDLALPDARTREHFFGYYSGVNSKMFRALFSAEKSGTIATLFGVHMLIVGSILTVPLAYGIAAFLRPNPKIRCTPEQAYARVLAGLAAVIAISLVALTSIFTAAVAVEGSGDTADRLHTRFYSFVLPLLPLAFLAAPFAQEWGARVRRAVAALWLAACLAALFVLPAFRWTIVDSPDLFVGGGAPQFAIAVFGLAGLGIAFLLRGVPNGMRTGVTCAFVFSALLSGLVARATQLDWKPLPEDRAARFVMALAEQNRVPVILIYDYTEGRQWPFRLGAYGPGITRFVPTDQIRNVGVEGLPAGSLLVGRHGDMPARGAVPVAKFGEITIARVPNPQDPGGTLGP